MYSESESESESGDEDRDDDEDSYHSSDRSEFEELDPDDYETYQNQNERKNNGKKRRRRRNCNQGKDSSHISHISHISKDGMDSMDSKDKGSSTSMVIDLTGDGYGNGNGIESIGLRDVDAIRGIGRVSDTGVGSAAAHRNNSSHLNSVNSANNNSSSSSSSSSSIRNNDRAKGDSPSMPSLVAGIRRWRGRQLGIAMPPLRVARLENADVQRTLLEKMYGVNGTELAKKDVGVDVMMSLSQSADYSSVYDSDSSDVFASRFQDESDLADPTMWELGLEAQVNRRIAKMDAHLIERCMKTKNKLIDQKMNRDREQYDGKTLKRLIEEEKDAFKEYRHRQYRERKEILLETEVVLCTLSGAGRKQFHDFCTQNNISFDTVIVDEAAQATEPATLIPLQFQCKNLVLVGDTCQLPPTILHANGTTAANGLGKGLFERLEKAGHKKFMLEIQYRMNPLIRQFPSLRFYNNQLRDSPQIEREGASNTRSAENAAHRISLAELSKREFFIFPLGRSIESGAYLADEYLMNHSHSRNHDHGHTGIHSIYRGALWSSHPGIWLDLKANGSSSNINSNGNGNGNSNSNRRCPFYMRAAQVIDLQFSREQGGHQQQQQQQQQQQGQEQHNNHNSHKNQETESEFTSLSRSLCNPDEARFCVNLALQ